MWRERVPLAEWQRILDDPTTMQAWIIQSGRKMRQFRFQRNSPLPAPAQ